MTAKRPGLRLEIATTAADIYVPQWVDLLRPTDDVLIDQGGAKDLKIYDEIERDPQAYSVLQKRKLGLIARDWEIEPGGKRRQDKKAHELAERVVAGEWGLSYDKVCLDLLDATLKGYGVAEIIWDLADGFIIPVDIKPKNQRRFHFAADGALRMKTRENSYQGIELPERKFLVHRFGDKTGDPYGRGLGHQLYWWVFFKRMATQFWLVFAEKFGSPTVVGAVSDLMTEEEEDDFLARLETIAQRTALTVPAGAEIKFLEAIRSGTVTYPELIGYCDRMITLAVLGETLTTSEGSSGSRALGEVHQEVKDEIIDADADMLSATINDQLLRWLTELNYPDAVPPRLWRPRPTEEGEKAKTEQEKIKALQAALDFVNRMRATGWEPADPQAGVMDQAQGTWTYTGKASGVGAAVEARAGWPGRWRAGPGFGCPRPAPRRHGRSGRPAGRGGGAGHGGDDRPGGRAAGPGRGRRRHPGGRAAPAGRSLPRDGRHPFGRGGRRRPGLRHPDRPRGDRRCRRPAVISRSHSPRRSTTTATSWR
jgi:hypothetical protein